MLEIEHPVETLLEILGRRGSFPILWALVEGPQRFSSLQQITGLPPRTLSLRLKELEETDLIKRTSYPQVPPRVDYALTPKGLGVQPALAALDRWHQDWRLEAVGVKRSSR